MPRMLQFLSQGGIQGSGFSGRRQRNETVIGRIRQQELRACNTFLAVHPLAHARRRGNVIFIQIK